MLRIHEVNSVFLIRPTLLLIIYSSAIDVQKAEAFNEKIISQASFEVLNHFNCSLLIPNYPKLNMKLLTSLLLCLLSATMIAQSYNEGVLSLRLQQLVDEDPNEKHLVYVLLTDHVDVDALEDSFDARKVNLQERAYELITTLQAKADATQPALIEDLRQLDGLDPNSIAPFWVNNAIFFRANRSAIATISQRDDIYWMDMNVENAIEEYEEVSCALPPSPDGIENGLAAINAPALWQMGYTGYGGKAFGADTGIDQFHPAIVYKYAGYYQPNRETWVNFGVTGQILQSDTFPSQCGDHGNHTLGTILGLDRNTNDTIGVAFGSLWIGTRILCDGIGTVDNIAAFQWALNPDGDVNTIDDMPQVINNSWWDSNNTLQGQGQCTSIYIDIVSALEAAGIANIFSAGNNGSGASTITAPKNINTDTFNIFCVAALNGNISSYPITGFSSRGPSLCPAPAGGSLEIKPEVAAPGENVRSCELDGGYGSKSGTSMAAPHVAGAVLLLREAFPEITGKDALRALYHSCLDLGTPGEDNNYGMGLIDVLAAYNYLLDQGLTAVQPHAVNDALLVHIENKPVLCAEVFSNKVTIENAGTDTLTSLEIHVSIRENTVEVASFVDTWTGSLANLEREEITVEGASLEDGDYEVVITLANPNGVADEKPLNNVGKSFFQRTMIEPYTVSVQGVDSVGTCEFGRSLLYCDFNGLGSISWYSSETSETELGIGNYYLTPALSFEETYYAEVRTSEFGGKETYDLEQTEIPDNNDGRLIFNSSEAFLLRSVKIYSETAGPRMFSLSDAAQTWSIDKLVDVSATGEQRVILNMEVPDENNLRFGIAAGQRLPYSTDASYPYDLGGVGIIYSSSGNSMPSSTYYGFYDWEIQRFEACERIPVVASVVGVDQAPEADFSPSETIVNLQAGGDVAFTDESADALSWYWDFGDGTTSTEQNPNHIYTEVGSYLVTLTVVGSEGCSDTNIETIAVVDIVIVNVDTPGDLSGQVELYPNPTSELLQIAFNLDRTYDLDIEVYDVFGQLLRSIPTNQYYQEQMTLDVSELPTGLYYVVFESEGVKTPFKVVVD